MKDKIEYGTVSGRTTDAPVKLKLSAKAAKRIYEYLVEKGADALPIEDSVWDLWAVLDDIFPAE